MEPGVVTARVLLSPRLEQRQRAGELSSHLGELVGHAQRPFRIRRGHDDPLGLEGAEASREDIGCDAAHLVLDLTEAAGLAQERIDDQERPTIADPGHRFGQGGVLLVISHASEDSGLQIASD